MPTTRPRYQITETPDVARALDLAARRWPGEPRARLLLRLVAAGSDALDRSTDRADRLRRAAVVASSGKYADAFSADHLEELRRDWPQ